MKALGDEVLERARRVRLMVFDVDGVLTDGRLWFGADGEVMKAFHVRDGHGMKMLAANGVACALLSGRRSAAVTARAAELGIVHVLQGIEDKRSAFEALVTSTGATAQSAGFMGDELVDLPVLSRCGLACAPGDADAAVRERVHYVTAARAGEGAAREVCELVMRAQGTLTRALQSYLA